MSRGYNLLIKLTFATRFSDAQCGFKAIGASAAGLLLPLVHDREWFFDTELLILAEKTVCASRMCLSSGWKIRTRASMSLAPCFGI